jgi:hypothetical protein
VPWRRIWNAFTLVWTGVWVVGALTGRHALFVVDVVLVWPVLLALATDWRGAAGFTAAQYHQSWLTRTVDRRQVRLVGALGSVLVLVMLVLVGLWSR